MEIKITDKPKTHNITKWIITVVTACILIYLAIRHMNMIAAGVSWFVNLIQPILVGMIIAFVLNVPMRPIEKHLHIKNQKAKRPLAIFLSLVLVTGIFMGVAFLVIPEIVDTIRLITQIIMSSIDHAALKEQTVDFSAFPLGEYLGQIDIDWIHLKNTLEKWMLSQRELLLMHTAEAISSIVLAFINFFIGIVFSIYILANKEKLKLQILRLLYAWFPEKFNVGLIHVVSICNRNFRNFITGQATEAFILGNLCALGMLILRLPYAPMIGALVGVTALIPIVGAFIGAIIGAFLLLTVDPFKTFVFIIFLTTLQQFEGDVIYPKVVGSKINLPAIWVFAAVTVGGNLAGPLGMLFSVPTASVIYELLKEATLKRELKSESLRNNQLE